MNHNSVTYKQHNNKFYIVSEWSRYPVESFNYEIDAQHFIKGYNHVSVKEQTDAYLLGLAYRKAMDIDASYGVQYTRYNPQLEVMPYAG